MAMEQTSKKYCNVSERSETNLLNALGAVKMTSKEQNTKAHRLYSQNI
jgi:hypothetical protein